MNTTFLIGNGFDINLGLKTQYTDFYGTYIEKNKHLPDDNCIKKFCNLIDKDYEKWSYFEKAFAEKATGTIEEIALIIDNFDNLFSEYLSEQCKLCIYDSSVINNELERFIMNNHTCLERKDNQYLTKWKMNHMKENYEFNFIDFNYTDVLDKLVSKHTDTIREQIRANGTLRLKTEVKPPIHIHGSLKENYIIVGVDKLQQFLSNSLKTSSRLERHCVKSVINAENGYSNKENNYKQIISSSDLICVYGIAFGDTDRSRWDVLAQWLANSVEHKIIIFKYNSGFPELDGMSKGRLLDAIDLAREEFLKIICTSEDQREKIRKTINEQIFVADSSKALNFKLVGNIKTPIVAN